jgi:hypothetical protein
MEGNGKRINRRGTTIEQKGFYSHFVYEMEEQVDGEKNAGNR